MTNVSSIEIAAEKAAGGRQKQPTDDAWPFAPLDTHAAISEPPPAVDWLFHERMQLGRGVLITGIGGSSKTRLLYYAAIAAAIGRFPWSWQVTRCGSSVLILTEDTADDVHRTIWHICNVLCLTHEEKLRVAQRVVCYPVAGQTCRLLGVDPSSGDLVQNGTLAGLEEVINRRGNVVFIGLDPALGLTPGDELNQGHQRSLGKLADDLAVRTGAAVALVAHATKASLATEELGSHNSRGGGAITDAVRGEFSLRTMTAREATAAGITDIEERKRHVQLVCTKGNHVPPAAYVPVWLRRGEFGTLSEASLEFGNAPAAGPNREDIKALDVLREMCKTRVPRLLEWREQCHAAGLIGGANPENQKKQMQAITGRLMNGGMLKHGSARGFYLPIEEEGNGTE